MDYVSLHGTGTSLGDPIEVGAIGGMLQSSKHANANPQVLSLGSSKASIGHTESTAGLAGLLLASLALTKSLGAPFRFRNMNPYVTSALKSWPSIAKAPISQAPLAHSKVAGTSSFGMTGVNSHAVISVGSFSPRFVSRQFFKDTVLFLNVCPQLHCFLDSPLCMTWPT